MPQMSRKVNTGKLKLSIHSQSKFFKNYPKITEKVLKRSSHPNKAYKCKLRKTDPFEDQPHHSYKDYKRLEAIVLLFSNLRTTMRAME